MRERKGRTKSHLVAVIMRHQASVLRVITLLALIPFGAYAQKQNDVNQDPVRRLSLIMLEDVLIESRDYDDKELRARVKAQVADVIWPFEPARAKELIITALDEALELKGPSPDRFGLRSEIIGVARRHDADLAARLISQVENKSDEEGGIMTRDSLERITERGALYLESARDLLNAGNQERAIDFAKRSFTEGRSAQFIWFLIDLHKVDSQAADNLFLDALKMLSRAADPNDVLYFGLYVFDQGNVSAGRLPDGTEAISYGRSFRLGRASSDRLIHPYLRAAVQALLRFQVMPGQPGPSGSVALKRFALSQLLPLCERYEAQLAPDVRDELRRQGTSERATAAAEDTAPRIAGELSAEDMIAKIERLTGTRERDHYFFEGARTAAESGDFEGARRLAGKISDINSKQGLLEMVSFKEAQLAIRRGDMEQAAAIAASRLKRDQSAVIYFQASSAWAERKDYVRANELVRAAVLESSKIEDKEQRARLYSYLAAGLAKQDTLLAFELIESAVKDMNTAEMFKLPGDHLTLELRTPLNISYRFVFMSGGSFLSVLPYLAVNDFYRTITLSKSLRSPGARALSIIVTCRAVLNSNGGPAKTKKSVRLTERPSHPPDFEKRNLG